MFPSILIVDDEPDILKTLGGLLTDEGYDVSVASNGYEALKIIDHRSPDIVLLDIWMPGMDGYETLKQIKKSHAHLQVIIISGHGNVEMAVRAIKLGAYDLIEKPINIDRVIVSINNALNFRRLEEENRYLRKKTLEKNSITGNSPAIVELKKHISVAAPTDAWVLISGENGVGKELAARSIHLLSKRAAHPMIDVNCAAVSDDKLVRELFGNENGGHAKSSNRRFGKFELAGGGTIFLDEIGDMSLKNQGMMLRVLQEQKLQRVGGQRDIAVDVRVISATSKNLEKEIEGNRFREELFYRINVIPIEIPPLRRRREDLPLLVNHFLNEAAANHGNPVKTVDENVFDLFAAYHWPGNVRELKNLVERLSIMVPGDGIRLRDLPFPYRPHTKGK